MSGLYSCGAVMTKKEKYEYLLELARSSLKEHEVIVNFINGFNPKRKECMCAQCEILREVVGERRNEGNKKTCR
jgi:hypothetical protein